MHSTRRADLYSLPDPDGGSSDAEDRAAANTRVVDQNIESANFCSTCFAVDSTDARSATSHAIVLLFPPTPINSGRSRFQCRVSPSAEDHMGAQTSQGGGNRGPMPRPHRLRPRLVRLTPG